MTEDSIECSACGSAVPRSANFCGQCGNPVAKSCVACGMVLPAGSKFCLECGTALAGTAPAEPQEPPAERPAEADQRPVEADEHGEGERRQLTVMFCDMVNSTHLVRQVGAESYRAINRRYRALCVPIIEGYDGFVSRYMGDGFLATFGYPQAHEDDAERAGRAGLDIVDSIARGQFNDSDGAAVELAVRVGIATGLVVIADVVGKGTFEVLEVSGDTPNLASRIQQVAVPNSVVVSAATKRLVEGALSVRSAGRHAFKGFGEHIEVFEVTGIDASVGDTYFQPEVGPTTLIGREPELTLLQDRWDRTRRGKGCAFLVQGEAGIGKSRLVWELRHSLAGQPHYWIEFRCSSYLRNSPLYPVIDFLRRSAAIAEDDVAEVILEKLSRAFPRRLASVDQLRVLTQFIAPHGADEAPIQQSQNQFLNAFVALLVSLADDKPVVILVEDLHWVDPSTQRFLTLVVDQIPMAPIMAVVTARPECHVDWVSHSHTMHMKLGNLDQNEVEQMIAELTSGTPIPMDTQRQLLSKTDGVPLYVEELTRAIVESTQAPGDAGEPAESMPIPDSLRDSLMARLDRLGSPKRLAQTASVLGRTFTYGQLKAVARVSDERLNVDLAELTQAQVLYQHGMPPESNYQFRHALIQSAAYESILTAKRREYHQRVAAALTEHFPEVGRANPELVARHIVLAGDSHGSLDYWTRAAQLALRRGVGIEAIAHAREGLAYVDSPQSDAVHREIELQTTLAAALSAIQGFASTEVREAYERAHELCTTSNAGVRYLFPVLQGLHQVFHAVGPLARAREVGEQLVKVADENSGVLERRAEAHRSLGYTTFCLGDFVGAREIISHALSLYNSTLVDEVTRLHVTDGGGAGLSNLSLVEWMLGDINAAGKASTEAVRHAREIDHSYTLAYALCMAAALQQMCRKPKQVVSKADEAIDIADRYEFKYWAAFGRVLVGWGQFMDQPSAVWLDKVRDGLGKYRATNSRLLAPYALSLLAECEITERNWTQAGAALDEAEAIAAQFQTHFYDAEILRLRAEVCVENGERARASQLLHSALDLAETQCAASLQKRALAFGARTGLTDAMADAHIAQVRKAQLG